MSFPKNLIGIPLLAVLLVSAAAQNSRVGSVGKVLVVSESPFQIQIQVNQPSSPQVQLVPNPERLVIDIPNSTAGTGLRGLTLKRGDIRGVRISQYSVKPPITRVVVDLNAPQWYRVAPNPLGLLVSLGSDTESAGNARPPVGWVTAKMTNSRTAPVVLRTAVAVPVQQVSGVTVRFAKGELTIHAQNATLSEVLFEIQKRTGAEIAIPSGTEQDRVAADFGPGTPSQVMAELLNGTGLNFVVVGSTDPNQLRSVVLSRKTGGADPPSAFQVADTPPPPTAPVIDPRNFETTVPTPIGNDPQQEPQQVPSGRSDESVPN